MHRGSGSGRLMQTTQVISQYKSTITCQVFTFTRLIQTIDSSYLHIPTTVRVAGLECCRVFVFFTKWSPYTGKVTSPRILLTVLISMVTPYEVRLRWVDSQRKEEEEEKDTR